jgi:hypothetical protein
MDRSVRTKRDNVAKGDAIAGHFERIPHGAMVMPLHLDGSVYGRAVPEDNGSDVSRSGT